MSRWYESQRVEPPPAGLRPRVRLGIAGWSYADWKGRVYPAGCKDTLRFCAGYVHCIEVNSTFYRPPAVRTTESWAKRTADLAHFAFTAKLPQEFTHLQDWDQELLTTTREGFRPLVEAGKLKALLAQFSYRFTVEGALAGGPGIPYLRRLWESFGDLCPLVVEVRHRSWEDPAALAALRELPVSVANLDYPGRGSGFGLWNSGIFGPARVAYLRLHGRNYETWFDKNAGRDATYDYQYAAAEVAQIARRTVDLAQQAAETLVIANNHYHGKSMKVVLELMAWLKQQPVPVPDDLRRTYPDLADVQA